MTGDLPRQLRELSENCGRLGSPLYAGLLAQVAEDVAARGPLARVLAGHEADPAGAAVGLRLLGTVHRLVLEGVAPELAAYYPSVGGTADPAGAWPALRRLVSARADEIRAGLTHPPQTNEVGRSAALAGALLHLLARAPLPVRLHEIGASAGLNLRVDRFHFGGVADWGPPESPVRLDDAWHGAAPPVDAPLRVVERLGYDLAPVDPGTLEGRRRLTAYVWADQTDRLARLRGAFEVAAAVPAVVERASAADAVRRLRLAPGAWTVLWHSVVWQYLDRAEKEIVRERLAALGARADTDAPLAHVTFEPRAHGEATYPVVIRAWPGRERLLGRAPPHGLPVTWE